MDLPRHAVNDCRTRTRARAAVALRADFERARRQIWLAAIALIVGIAITFGLSGVVFAQQEIPSPQPVGQPIAILQTPTPVPLSCSDNDCVAVLSSISLDEFSPLPTPGQAYALLEGEGRAIIVSTANGESEPLTFDRLDMGRIVADKGYSRVTLSIPETTLRGVGIATDGVQVSVLRTAVGQAVDDEFGFVKDRALPSGSIGFQEAVEFLSADATERPAGLIAGQLIARTIAGARADGAEQADVRTQWAQIRAQAASDAAVPDKALRLVEGAMARCAGNINGLLPTETCLWSHHDGFLSELNRAYWRSADTGA